MESCLAAVLARPLGLRSDKSDSGAARVVVDLVGCREERVDVLLGEEVRGALRSVDYAELPVVRDLRDYRIVRNGGALRRIVCLEVQDVSGLNRASRVAAEVAEREGGAAAEVLRAVNAALEGEIGSRAGAKDLPELQDLPLLNHERAVHGDRLSVKRCLYRCAGDDSLGVAVERHVGARDGDLERCGALVISEDAVCEAERVVVERP